MNIHVPSMKNLLSFTDMPTLQGGEARADAGLRTERATIRSSATGLTNDDVTLQPTR